MRTCFQVCTQTQIATQRKRLRFGEEGQNEGALTFIKNRSKRYVACSDLTYRNTIDAGRRWGPTQWGGAFAPYKRFGPLAQNLGAGRIHFARAFESKGEEAAFGRRNPKRKGFPSETLPFCRGRLKSIFLNGEKCRPQGGLQNRNPAKRFRF